MLDDRSLAAPGDENHLLDPRLARLVDRILDQRSIDDREQFLRDRLGRREEAGAEPGYGEDGFPDRLETAHACLDSTGNMTRKRHLRQSRRSDAQLAARTIPAKASSPWTN